MSSMFAESHPLHRLFRGLTEHAFQAELGIADPNLVDYMARLLVRFVPTDALYALRDEHGARLREVAAMLASAESCGDDARRRETYRQIGDFTLFWTGVYPEAIARAGPAGFSSEGLVGYQRQGKRSYLLASTYDGVEAPVLRRLSAEFELCAFGLSRVRREWEALPGAKPASPRDLIA